MARGRNAGDLPVDLTRAESLRRKAERFWQTAASALRPPEVPDAGVQALLDSAIRNIYQAREIKKGLPAFQVGPTCYRGLWVVDGSFLLEAMTYLGRADETRNGVKYLMSFQRDDGGFMLMDAHWKETGIALWAITRHARLTGDKDWLREAWPSVERGFAFIRKMRGMPAAEAPERAADSRWFQRRRPGGQGARIHQHLLDNGRPARGHRGGPLARQGGRGRGLAKGI